MANLLSPVWEPSTLEQHDFPDNIPELSGSAINEEQRKLLSDNIIELRRQEIDYLSSHPEIRAFLGEFLHHIWDFMPPLNLFPKFCRDYFSQCKYELQTKINKRVKKNNQFEEVGGVVGAESNNKNLNKKFTENDNITVQRWYWSSDSESEEEEKKLCTLRSVHEFVSYEKYERKKSIWRKPTHLMTHNYSHLSQNPKQVPTTEVRKKRQSQIIRERFLVEPSATTPAQQTHDEIVQKAFDEFLSDMKDK